MEFQRKVGIEPENSASDPGLNFKIASDSSPSTEFERDIIRASVNGESETIYELWRSHDSVHMWGLLLYMHARNEDRYSLLHIAVVSKQTEVVKAILHGSDSVGDSTVSHLKFDFLHARTSEGWTALHLAVVSENVDVLEILMATYDSVSKRPEISWDFADCWWMTPLHYAVLENLEVQMKLLLEWELYHQHVNARDFFQRTPLHMASYHCPVSVKVFVECAHVDIYAVDCVTHSPLHWATCFGRVEAVECLVEKLLTVEAFDLDIEGQSLLDIAEDSVVVNLPEPVIRKELQVPDKCDGTFLMNSQKMVHKKVGTKITSLLQMVPGVKNEVERLRKSLQFYLTATSSILVVAALIASSSFGLSFDGSDHMVPTGLAVEFVVAFRTLAFYLAVITLVISSSNLYILGLIIPGRTQLRITKFALRLILVVLALSVLFLLLAFQGSTGPYLKNLHRGLIVSNLFVTSCLILIPVALTFYISHLRESSFIGTYHNRQRDLMPKYLEALVSRLYSSEVQRKSYWPMWQIECRGTNAIKAYNAYRVPRGGTEIEGEAELQNNYIQFVQEVFNVTGFFSPPNTVQVLNLMCRELLRMVIWVCDRVLLRFPPFRELGETNPVVETQRLVMCSLFGGHFDKSYCPGTLPSSDQAQLKSKDSRRMGDDSLSPFTFAVQFWRQRDVSIETIQEFKRMESQIRIVESVYKKWSRNMGDVLKEGEKARHFMFFLDRLPGGILYWANTCSISNLSHGFYQRIIYSLIFQLEFAQVISRKPGIIIFYQGYVLQRDFERSQAISVEVKYKQKAFADVNRTSTQVHQSEKRREEMVVD